jgi:hypothetical protein
MSFPPEIENPECDEVVRRIRDKTKLSGLLPVEVSLYNFMKRAGREETFVPARPVSRDEPRYLS